MLAERIFEWAKRTPDKAALIRDDRAISYAVLADTVARARGYFVRAGIVGEGYATIASSDQALVWVFSVALRSLGVTVMTRGYDLADAPLLKCAVTTPSDDIPQLAELCRAGGTPLLTVSLQGEAGLGLDEGPKPLRPGGQVLHTSGTTGAHKKVLVDPDFEEAFLRRRGEITGIDAQTMITAFNCPVWTGAGYKPTACAWLVGGTAVIHQNPPRHRPLQYPGLTEAMVSPTILKDILAAPADAFPRNENLILIVGGGAVSQPDAEAAKARISPRLYNMLAATEGGTFGMTLLDGPDDRRWHRAVPGAGVEIVDPNDQPVAPGQVGRVRISTADGPAGYLGDDAATLDFFKDGFFYTGDLAALRSDGRFSLEGRVNDVIVLQGVKSAAGPMEDRLAEALGLEGVVLFTVEDADGEDELHVALESSGPFDAQRLAAALRAEFRTLPKAQVHTLPAFPRNAMGKVARADVKARIVALARQSAA